MSRMCAGDSASVAAAFHLGVRAGRSSVHTPWCMCVRARQPLYRLHTAVQGSSGDGIQERCWGFEYLDLLLELFGSE